MENRDLLWGGGRGRSYVCARLAVLANFKLCVYHGATGESIEHVEEDKASEGHSGVPWSDHLILHLRNIIE